MSGEPKFSGALPDGTRTTSVKRYTREWREVAKLLGDALEASTGHPWHAIGYEPGVLLGRKDARSIDVDPRLVKALLPILRAAKKGTP